MRFGKRCTFCCTLVVGRILERFVVAFLLLVFLYVLHVIVLSGNFDSKNCMFLYFQKIRHQNVSLMIIDKSVEVPHNQERPSKGGQLPTPPVSVHIKNVFNVARFCFLYFTVPFQQRNQVCIFNSVFSNCIIVYVFVHSMFLPQSTWAKRSSKKCRRAHIITTYTRTHPELHIPHQHSFTSAHLYVSNLDIRTYPDARRSLFLSSLPAFPPSSLPFPSFPFLSFPFPVLSCPEVSFPFLSIPFLSFPFFLPVFLCVSSLNWFLIVCSLSFLSLSLARVLFSLVFSFFLRPGATPTSHRQTQPS